MELSSCLGCLMRPSGFSFFGDVITTSNLRRVAGKRRCDGGESAPGICHWKMTRESWMIHYFLGRFKHCKLLLNDQRVKGTFESHSLQQSERPWHIGAMRQGSCLGPADPSHGKRIPSEHHENHPFRTQPFFITSEHHVSHQFRTQPKNRASWLLTSAALWKVTRSKRCVHQKKASFRDCFLTSCFQL